MEFIEIIEAVTQSKYFDRKSPFACRFDRQEGARCLVVTGDNASGKSFFRQALKSYAITHGGIDHVIDLGMHRRTRHGIERAVIFGGTDDSDSTGAISTNAILKALDAIASTEEPHILILDEPDIGLSDGYARAMGELIGTSAGSTGEATRGIVIISHNRSLVRALIEQCPVHWLRMGDELSKTDWLDGTEFYRSVDDLRTLWEQNKAGYSRLRKIIAPSKP